MLNLFEEKEENGQILPEEYLTEGLAVPPLVAVIVVALCLSSCPTESI